MNKKIVLITLLALLVTSPFAIAETPDFEWELDTYEQWNEYLVEEGSDGYVLNEEDDLLEVDPEAEEMLVTFETTVETEEDFVDMEQFWVEIIEDMGEHFTVELTNLDQEENFRTDDLEAGTHSDFFEDFVAEDGDTLELLVMHPIPDSEEVASIDSYSVEGYDQTIQEPPFEFQDVFEGGDWEESFVEEESENIVFDAGGNPRTDEDQTYSKGVFHFTFDEPGLTAELEGEGEFDVIEAGNYWDITITNVDTFNSITYSGVGEDEEHRYGDMDGHYFNEGDLIEIVIEHDGAEEDEEAGVNSWEFGGTMHEMVHVNNLYPEHEQFIGVEYGEFLEIPFQWEVDNTLDQSLYTDLVIDDNELGLNEELSEYSYHEIFEEVGEDSEYLESPPSQQTYQSFVMDEEGYAVQSSNIYEFETMENSQAVPVKPEDTETLVGGTEEEIDVDFEWYVNSTFEGEARLYLNGVETYTESFNADEDIVMETTETVENYETYEYTIILHNNEIGEDTYQTDTKYFNVVEEEPSILTNLELTSVSGDYSVGEILLILGISLFIVLAVVLTGWRR